MRVFQVTVYTDRNKIGPSNVRARDLQVIMWAKHIGRDRTCEVATEFLLVGTGSRGYLVGQWITGYIVYRLLTGWRRLPYVLHAHIRSCSRVVDQGGSWSHRVGTPLYLGRRRSRGKRRLCQSCGYRPIGGHCRLLECCRGGR